MAKGLKSQQAAGSESLETYTWRYMQPETWETLTRHVKESYFHKVLVLTCYEQGFDNLSCDVLEQAAAAIRLSIEHKRLGW